jgi:plasmid stability protein
MTTKWQPLFAPTRVIPGSSGTRVEGYQMGAILVRGLDQKTMERLKERARLNGRSLQQEVKVILKRTAGTPTMPEARRLAEQWSHRLRGRTFSDSMRLIREDRFAIAVAFIHTAAATTSRRVSGDLRELPDDVRVPEATAVVAIPGS